jgi:glucose/arabinose dehydrogenase
LLDITHNRVVRFEQEKAAKMRRTLIFIVCLIALIGTANGQNDIPCGERPNYLSNPWVDGTRFCLQSIIHDESAGEMGFTALATAPDGTLYAARPLHGQIFAITDTDGDDLPDSSRVVAENLTLPNGLAYHDAVLYISGGAHIYRFIEGEIETLVDDIPTGAGFWTGGVAIGDDERLYVATGAPCDACQTDDPARGGILSYALDGTDRQIIAEGLRQPVGLALHDGVLWTVDSARDGLFDIPDLDELNRVTRGVHFGWPYCIGNNQPDLFQGLFDCADATPPVMTFPTASHPTALASYIGDASDGLEGRLLVVLYGSYNHVDLRGYAIAAVRFDDAGNPAGYDVIIPQESDTNAFVGYTLKQMNYRTSGFWPRRPLGIAVSREGWVYVSVGGGQIWVLRAYP